MYNFVICHLYIVLCVHHPKSPSITIYPLLPSPTPISSGNYHTVVPFYEGFFLCLISSPFFTQPPIPCLSDSYGSVLCIYESISILFVSLFYLLDSTYNWNDMVPVFLWMAFSLGIMFSRPIHAVTKGESPFFSRLSSSIPYLHTYVSSIRCIRII